MSEWHVTFCVASPILMLILDCAKQACGQQASYKEPLILNEPPPAGPSASSRVAERLDQKFLGLNRLTIVK